MKRKAKSGSKSLPPAKVGNVTVPRWILNDGRMMIAYPTPDNPRKLQTFVDHDEGTAEAERRARDLHNGGAEAQSFTSADRADLAAAKKDVAPFLLPVHIATAQWAAEEKETRLAGFQRADVFKAGMEALRLTPHPVPAVVEEFLATLAPQDLHGRYRDGLVTTLRHFALDFTCDIRAVKAPQIQVWLDGKQDTHGIVSGGRRKRNGEPVGSRRRDNILREVRSVFEYARLNGYLPYSVTEATKVKFIDKRSGAISYFTIAETRLIIQNVGEEWVPFVALMLFNGFRVEELVKHRQATKRKDPLKWQDIDWEEDEIIVREETSKVDASRVVPLHEVTRQLLEPYRKASGYVGPRDPFGKFKRTDKEFGKGARLERAINAALKRAPELRHGPIQLDLIAEDSQHAELVTEFTYRSNAMRHSYGSYRASILKNVGDLAEEMGTSPAMIKKHYRNPRPTSEAKSYFALRVARDPVVIPFPIGKTA